MLGTFQIHLESTLKVSLITSLLYFNLFLFVKELLYSLITLIHICLFPKIKRPFKGGRSATVWLLKTKKPKNKKQKKSFQVFKDTKSNSGCRVSKMVWVIITAYGGHRLELMRLTCIWMLAWLFPNQSFLATVCILREYRRHGIPSCCCCNKGNKRNSEVAKVSSDSWGLLLKFQQRSRLSASHHTFSNNAPFRPCPCLTPTLIPFPSLATPEHYHLTHQQLWKTMFCCALYLSTSSKVDEKIGSADSWGVGYQRRQLNRFEWIQEGSCMGLDES